MQLYEVESIDAVIRQLDAYIEYCIENNNRMGYFASLYCAVTKKVKEGILDHRFEDGARMERLDVHFANYFFKATKVPREELSKAWNIVFEERHNQQHVILQHLLLGMNTHINFDLAFAVEESVDVEGLSALYKDYEEINALLIEEIDTMQEKINKTWWLYRVLDRIALRFDEAYVGFSIIQARRSAWESAEQLINEGNADEIIHQREEITSNFANKIIKPPFYIKILLYINHLFEPSSVSKLINTIRK